MKTCMKHGHPTLSQWFQNPSEYWATTALTAKCEKIHPKFVTAELLNFIILYNTQDSVPYL